LRYRRKTSYPLCPSKFRGRSKPKLRATKGGADLVTESVDDRERRERVIGNHATERKGKT